MRKLLQNAAIYQKFQDVLGFSDSRRKAIADYLEVPDGARVIDIGCGPGRILTYIPDSVDYVGFDVDERYIEYAQETYGDRARFYCRPFDESALDLVSNADIVMLNGVLHHLDDELADGILATASTALAPDGVLFTLDGCYRDGQNIVAKKLLDFDRGEYVRDESSYLDLMNPHFDAVNAHLRSDLSAIPYTFIIMMAKNEPGSAS